MVKNPFTPLRRTVKVLVVDDMPELLCTMDAMLDIFQIYSVHTADSTRRALEIIANSKERFHACLFDLGMSDVERNEFHLLDKFGTTIPFIVTTGMDDIEKAFECERRGAKAIIKKATVGFNKKLLSSLDRFALLNMLCPRHVNSEDVFLARCVEALTKSNPEKVCDWAREANADGGRLRKEWKRQFGMTPKHALCVFHVFSGMFTLIENACVNTDSLPKFDTKESGETLLESTSYKKCFEYYMLNRREIDTHIF